MSFNPYRALLGLLPSPATQVGVVASVASGVATITLPGGVQIQARGQATVGQSVYVRDGVIEGEASALPVVEIDI